MLAWNTALSSIAGKGQFQSLAFDCFLATNRFTDVPYLDPELTALSSAINWPQVKKQTSQEYQRVE
jgi:hypothetical protein